MKRIWQGINPCWVRNPPRLDRAVANGLPFHGLLQCLRHGFVAENADHERRIRVGKRVGGPIDESREVVQEGRFDAMLQRGIWLRLQGHAGENSADHAWDFLSN